MVSDWGMNIGWGELECVYHQYKSVYEIEIENAEIVRNKEKKIGG